MKISIRTGVAAGVVLAATGILLGVTNEIEQHRTIELQANVPVEMHASLEVVEQDIAARLEAEEVTSVIDHIHTVSLSSYQELLDARALYENASGEARTYIDIEELTKAEQAYELLEQQRETLLQEAQERGDLNGILDYAPYVIQTSGNEELDTRVQELIANATTEDMSRSEQLAACYDYMVRNFSYGYNYNYSYGQGAKSVAWANAFLRDGYGACNNWSSAFLYVARALGYETNLYYGATASSGGGSVEHYWTVVTIDGTQYVFDPQVEGDMTRRSGVNQHKRFGLTGSVASGKYFFQSIVE